jgi:hypothetical protein
MLQWALNFKDNVDMGGWCSSHRATATHCVEAISNTRSICTENLHQPTAAAAVAEAATKKACSCKVQWLLLPRVHSHGHQHYLSL